MLFNALVLVVAFFATVSADNGYLLSSYYTGGSCSSTYSTYKVTGVAMNVCQKATFAAPDYAVAERYTSCNTYTGTYTLTKYMDSSCSDDSVINKYTISTDCNNGVKLSCSASDQPWLTLGSGLLDVPFYTTSSVTTQYCSTLNTSSVNEIAKVTSFTYKPLNKCDSGSVSGQSSTITMCRDYSGDTAEQFYVSNSYSKDSACTTATSNGTVTYLTKCGYTGSYNYDIKFCL